MPVEISFCKVCFGLECDCTQDELDHFNAFAMGQEDFVRFEDTGTPPSAQNLANVANSSEAFRRGYFEGWVEN